MANQGGFNLSIRYDQDNIGKPDNGSNSDDAEYGQANYKKVTAESLVEHPKTSSVVPSDCGKWGLFTASRCRIGTSISKEIWMMRFAMRTGFPVSKDSDAHDACWIPGSLDVLYLCSNGAGGTRVWTFSSETSKHEQIAEYDTELHSLQLKKLQDGTIVFMAAGMAGRDGSLFWKDHVHCVVIKNACIACGDGVRRSLFYNVLSRVVVEHDTDHGGDAQNNHNKDSDSAGSSSRYTIPPTLHNLIPSRNLEAPSGLCQTGFTTLVDNFAIGPNGVAVIARDLGPPTARLQQIWHLPEISHPYFVPVSSYAEPSLSQPRPVFPQTLQGTSHGRASCIRQSPDGSVLAFLFAPHTTSDFEDRRVYISTTERPLRASPLPNWRPVQEDGVPAEEEQQQSALLGGDEPPLRFDFAGRADALVYLARRRGRVGLFGAALDSGACWEMGAAEGTATAYHPLLAGDWQRLVVSRSTWTESCVWEVVDRCNADLVRLPSWNGSAAGARRERIVVTPFPSAARGLLDGFVVFSEDRAGEPPRKKHPWILALHGSRGAAWTDSWRQQFNPIAWAQRGYIVILPNVSGSPGYGSEFRKDSIQACGQRPVHDLVEVIKRLMDSQYIDPRKGILYAAAHAADLVYSLGLREIIHHFCGVILRDPVFPRTSWAVPPVQGRIPWIFDPRIENPAEEFARYPKGEPELLSRPPLALLTVAGRHYQAPSTERALLHARSLRHEHLPRPLIEGVEAADWNERDLEWYRVAFEWADERVADPHYRGTS